VDGRSLMPQGFDNPAAPFAGGIKPQALYRCAPRRFASGIHELSCLLQGRYIVQRGRAIGCSPKRKMNSRKRRAETGEAMN
jgi:hypothetical protein